MATNLARFKSDLAKLIDKGDDLFLAMKLECSRETIEAAIKKQLGDKAAEFIKELPQVRKQYQQWYSEALVLLRQLLPDRVSDFMKHYEKPKGRKNITYENYRIDDYLQGLNVTSRQGLHTERIVGPDAALPHLEQQVAILRGAEARFESSLFEIRQLVQADLLDSELAVAEELAKHQFVRAAGAIAGVVLEKHLAQVCEDHKVSNAKKNPTISVFNELLRAAGVIDLPQSRFIQHLADIRNLCDHGRKAEPTAEQVADLIAGVTKITNTVY
jgi:hypothetical protein